MNLHVFYGSQNKQWLFPYTASTGWFSQPRRSMFTARYRINISVQFRLILVFKGPSIPSGRRKLFILKRVQSVQLSSLQQSPPACRHALKLSRTWNDTVDFHPTTFIPGGLQKKKGTSFYFSPPPPGDWGCLTWTRWIGTLVPLSVSLLPTALLRNVRELPTFKKIYSL